MNRNDLEGQIAVVTGAARRTGLAVVELLLASGATVSIWHGDGPATEKTVRKLSKFWEVQAGVVDITDPDAVARANRGDGGAFRRHRCPRQQRRHFGAEHAGETGAVLQ